MSSSASDLRPGELDFPAARQQIETEIERFLASSNNPSLELPKIVFEKGETRVIFSPPLLEKEQIYDALTVLKSHIENIRIHTMDNAYVVFQSMGSNLYDTKQFTSGIKFKFIGIGYPRIEVSRTGNLVQEEVQSVVALFKLFHPSATKVDPTAVLTRMGASVYGFGESDHADLTETWDSIGGYERTKQEVQETILLPLRHPEVFQDVARLSRGGTASLPRAVLFEGPPGVGKTTMARILAREAGFPLVYVPVENILSKYYGESSQNMAAIFDAAAAFDRGILFLDEIDSLAGSREDGLIEATRRILSVLLRKIDGFEKRTGILTIGATNRAMDLDRALLSRFDTIVRFPMPDARERGSIFEKYVIHMTSDELKGLAELAEGLSGRNIRDICEMAERRWARRIVQEGIPASAPPASVYVELVREKIRDIEWLRL